jgi:light-regulated signal transduction histidine kinase (bacteriophytochrome)
MLIFRDIQELKDNLRLQQEIKHVNLMSSFMSHEMLSPLKCINELILKIQSNLGDKAKKNHYCNVICSTAQLMLQLLNSSMDENLLNTK